MVAAEITSAANPRIKRLAGLRERRNRDQESVFVVEGTVNVERALAAGLQPLEIYYDPARFPRSPYLADDVVSVEAEALDRASYRKKSQGITALFGQFEIDLDGLQVGAEPLILVIEAIEKPGNLGAILRTADAVGAAVIAADPGTDPFNPNVIRASTGALFSVPLAVTDFDAALMWLRSRSVRVVAADPAAGQELWEADLTGACALIVGSEHLGLSDRARAAADSVVSIPMRGATDSLNASVSAAILAYEALRQRRS